ncbi:MAG TPA: oligopeptide ABC transporter permease [Candidatus Limnocylindria bacterium]|nr:oligopeptide ABC transporter permease [Candidatus Limnocylindria bacterium]
MPSPLRAAFERFRRHRLAMIGVAVIAFVSLISIAAPAIAPYDPVAIDLSASRQPPSQAHLFGTDLTGRDVLSRLIYGGQVSLTVGLSAALLSTLIGLVLGLVAGYFRGWADSVVMRLTEIILSYPLLVMIIVLAAVIGPGVGSIVLGVGLFGWPTTCRIVRGQTLSLREQDFVMAARSLGATHVRVISRHLIPLVLAPLTVTATFGVAYAVLLEAALSFLGLGIRPPQPSWGNMLSAAQSILILESMPWLWSLPGIAIGVTVLAVNFIGDGLRDALDPRQQIAGA